MKKFSIWIEQRNEEEVRNAVIAKVRTDLGGGEDDDEILQMNTSEMSDEMQQELLRLAPVANEIDYSQQEEMADFLKQPDTTVGSFLEKIVHGDQESRPTPEPETLPPTNNPAMTPQQSQNFPAGNNV